MAFRTIVVSKNCKLSYKLGFLIVRDDSETRIDLDEIETLIVESTAVSITCYLLVELLKNKINILFCDERHLPIGILNGLYMHTSSSKNIINQINFNDYVKQLCWTKIISNKISNQAALLRKYDHINESEVLENYIANLSINDETNREGHAAKVYFNALFGGGFSRNIDSDINSAINYGYAIILSLIAREIVASGYITQVGIWHHNEYNPFNFASDLMEPFRPIVDAFVLSFNNFDNFKEKMTKIFETIILVNGEKQYLDQAIRIYIRKIFRFLNLEDENIIEIKEYILPKYE